MIYFKSTGCYSLTVINHKALATVTWKCNNKKNIIVTSETNCQNAKLGKEPINYECNNNY